MMDNADIDGMSSMRIPMDACIPMFVKAIAALARKRLEFVMRKNTC